MSGIDIDPDTGYAKGVAQRPGAPFPEESNIPSGDLDPTLDEADDKPNAFGSDKTAAPDGVEDSTIDDPEGHDVPVTPEGAAEALNDGNHETGNETDNTAIAEWHAANNTSAEALTGGEHQTDPAVDPEAKPAARTAEPTADDKKAAEPTSKLDTPENTPADVAVEEDKPKRTRRTKAEIEADNAK